jgi:hypothetical protein
MAKPDASEYARYFGGYIDAAPDGDILDILSAQRKSFGDFLLAITEERAGYRYDEGKWSVKEVVGHIVDTERIFGARALAIARGERAPLPSYDQDEYVERANFDSRELAGLAREFDGLRRSHVELFGSFEDDAWASRGVAGGNELTVRAIAWILAGHLNHHESVLRARYL